MASSVVASPVYRFTQVSIKIPEEAATDMRIVTMRKHYYNLGLEIVEENGIKGVMLTKITVHRRPIKLTEANDDHKGWGESHSREVGVVPFLYVFTAQLFGFKDKIQVC